MAHDMTEQDRFVGAPAGIKPDPHKLHWVVRMHYRMRTASFTASFVGMAIQMWDKAYGQGAWILLVLQFLIYPQLVFWHARRAVNPLQAELKNMLLDSLLFGMWVAALGFPLWIAFTLYISSTLNNTISRGVWGIVSASLLFASGALLSIAVVGFRLSPETEMATVLMCMVFLPMYLLTIGNVSFTRNRKLRETRKKLQLGELALLRANEELRKQLDEIDLLQQQLHEQVIRDPLTGLYNRRYLDTTLLRELARCKREQRSLSLMMVDIDHFKTINDRYGHQAGDEVLKQIGCLLCDDARAEDVACRYGGEEFLLLQPNMPLDVSQERAEALRAACSAMTFRFQEFRIQTTISIGIASYPEHETSPDQLAHRADLALYRAKTEGRNRVIVFDQAIACRDETIP